MRTGLFTRVTFMGIEIVSRLVRIDLIVKPNSRFNPFGTLCVLLLLSQFSPPLFPCIPPAVILSHSLIQIRLDGKGPPLQFVLGGISRIGKDLSYTQFHDVSSI